MATFGIDPRRSAYFFKDREPVKDPATGHTKRIFHIVRPHVRANEQTVKMHFRGLRTFTWNNYAIHITVPGFHHKLVAEFDAAVEEAAQLSPSDRRRMITTTTAARRFKEVILKR